MWSAPRALAAWALPQQPRVLGNTLPQQPGLRRSRRRGRPSPHAAWQRVPRALAPSAAPVETGGLARGRSAAPAS